MTNENSRNMSFYKYNKFHTVLVANLPPLLKIPLLYLMSRRRLRQNIYVILLY